MPDNQTYIYKHKINKVLADKSPEYWAIVKKWCKCIYTNEELDAESRRLFQRPEDTVLHTNFMISLRNRLKVSCNSSYQKSPKRKSRKSRKRPIFEPAEISDYVPEKSNNFKQYSAPESDKAMVLGRLLIAGEEDIEEATDNAAEMIVLAVQIFLKNILSAILTSCRSYKTYDTCFKYSIGAGVPNPWIRNATDLLNTKRHCDMDPGLKINPQISKDEQITISRSACSSMTGSTNKRTRITVDQVYDALKLNRNIVANHSVYAIAVEQIALELDEEELCNNPASSKHNNSHLCI